MEKSLTCTYLRTFWSDHSHRVNTTYWKCPLTDQLIYILLTGSNNQFRNYESRTFTNFITNRIVSDKKETITNKQHILIIRRKIHVVFRNWLLDLSHDTKGQLILKCPFCVIVLTKKTNENCLRISVLASKMRSNQKKN